jgi:hypothetical protein
LAGGPSRVPNEKQKTGSETIIFQDGDLSGTHANLDQWAADGKISWLTEHAEHTEPAPATGTGSGSKKAVKKKQPTVPKKRAKKGKEAVAGSWGAYA